MTKKLITFSFGVLLIGFICFGCSNKSSNTERNTAINDSVFNNIIDVQKLKIDSLENVNSELKAIIDYWFDDYYRKDLKEKGIEDAEGYLYKDLSSNADMQDLIQDDAILGGIMTLDNNVLLIGSNHLLSCGSDGHVIVYYIFQYKIQKDKSIVWECVKKFSDN